MRRRRIGREATVEFPGQLDLGRIRVGDGDPVQRAVRIQHVHGRQVIGRRKVLDAGTVALGLERGGPVPGQRRLLIYLEHALLPFGLMGKLTADVPPRCQVTEGNAVKLQHHYLSGD